MNNIPKEPNHYTNNMDSYARIDNGLAKSQLEIGESSNLAQIGQTYTYNFDDSIIQDYVCILAVLAQASIDSSKRRFDVDITEEIKRIKKELKIKEHGYPSFWLAIRKGFRRNKINASLRCPMNYVYNLNLKKYKDENSALPMSYFFIKHKLDVDRDTSRRVENLISKYTFNLGEINKDDDAVVEDYLLLRNDFDELINDLKSLRISNKYTGLMSWLLDRAFLITPKINTNQNLDRLKTTLNKNKSALIRILYDTSKDSFMRCFKENL